MGFENSIDKKISKEQDKKNKISGKKAPKTKQLLVLTLDFVDCLKADERITYPITITIFDKYGAGTIIVDNDKELDRICNWAAFAKSNVIRASWPRREAYLDVSVGGRLVVDKEMLPELKNLSAVSPEDVKVIYDKLMQYDVLEEQN